MIRFETRGPELCWNYFDFLDFFEKVKNSKKGQNSKFMKVKKKMGKRNDRVRGVVSPLKNFFLTQKKNFIKISKKIFRSIWDPKKKNG